MGSREIPRVFVMHLAECKYCMFSTMFLKSTGVFGPEDRLLCCRLTCCHYCHRPANISGHQKEHLPALLYIRMEVREATFVPTPNRRRCTGGPIGITVFWCSSSDAGL